MSPNETHKHKAYNLRIPYELRAKFEFIAKEKGYTMLSKAYKDLIEGYVDKYEAENGRIELWI